jgi:hypothetical protein
VRCNIARVNAASLRHVGSASDTIKQITHPVNRKARWCTPPRARDRRRKKRTTLEENHKTEGGIRHPGLRVRGCNMHTAVANHSIMGGVRRGVAHATPGSVSDVAKRLAHIINCNTRDGVHHPGLRCQEIHYPSNEFQQTGAVYTTPGSAPAVAKCSTRTKLQHRGTMCTKGLHMPPWVLHPMQPHALHTWQDKGWRTPPRVLHPISQGA